jgi:hypothetical protein
VDGETAVLFWVPFFVLLARTGGDDIAGVLNLKRVSKGYQTVRDGQAESNLGIGLNLKPAIAQMTFAPKGIDGRRVVILDFAFLGVVTDAHADVIVACAATWR